MDATTCGDRESWERDQDEIDARIRLKDAVRLDMLAEEAMHVLFEAYRAGRFAKLGSVYEEKRPAATRDDVALLAEMMRGSARRELKSALSAVPVREVTDEAIEAGTAPLWDRSLPEDL